MRPGGRVILVERLLGQIGEPGLAPLTDLNMMLTVTGRERTLPECRALLKQAGFRLDKCSPTRSSMAVIEAGAAGPKTLQRAPQNLLTKFGAAAMGSKCSS